MGYIYINEIWHLLYFTLPYDAQCAIYHTECDAQCAIYHTECDTQRVIGDKNKIQFVNVIDDKK